MKEGNSMDQNYQNYQPQQQPPTNPGQGLGIASMVLGILGLTPYAGLLFSTVGLVLGVISKKKSTEVNMPSGMATAGLVCSIIGLAFSIICTICLSCAYCAAVSNPSIWY